MQGFGAVILPPCLELQDWVTPFLSPLPTITQVRGLVSVTLLENTAFVDVIQTKTSSY